MKKVLLLLAALLMVACLASCDGSDNKEATTDTSSSTEESVAQDVVLEISKSTIAEPEEFKATMEEYGAEIEELSDKDAFQFTFSAAEHKALLKDKKAETVSAFKAIEDDEESYVDKIEYDENFRNLKIYVDKEKKPESSSTEEFSAASLALVYQTYIGETQRTLVEIFYTGEAERIDAFTFPISFAFE